MPAAGVTRKRQLLAASDVRPSPPPPSCMRADRTLRAQRARWLAKAGEGAAAAPAEAAPRAPTAAAPAAAASGGEMPLPAHFAVLQGQFQALDKALSHARRLSQRTFRALRALVEKETRRSLRIEDLGRICAVAPDFFHVTKVELDGTEHVVVEHQELGRPAAEAKEGPRRTERTVLLRPRALDFRERLAGRVREHIADVLNRMPGQLEPVPAHQVRSVPPDVPLECVPDVTPVAAEWIGTWESGTESHGLASAALKPSKAAALRAAGVGSKAAAAVPGLEGLSPALIAMVQRREAVNNRRLASVGPAASQVLQLEEMRKHLVNCVWGHRSKKQGQSGSISVPALVSELRRRMPGLAAARGAAMVERLAA